MTDTHTHLYMADTFPDGGVEAVNRALEAGVGHMVFPCVDWESIDSLLRLHSAFPENTTVALGLHPTEVKEDWSRVLDKMETLLPGPFKAIGEVGIDLYHDASMREAQKAAFGRQLGWALEHSLPVLIHCRGGVEDTLEVIRDSGGSGLPLVFHSFTGSVQDVARIREVCDPWFGINGVVTFKNAPALRGALAEIGLDRILLETDAPWLSPAPLRGRVNESSRIPLIRDCIAATLGVSPEQVEKATDDNASLLGLR